MLYYRHSASFAHETGQHPENAGRIRAIEAALDATEWAGLDVREAPLATVEQLEGAHSAEHVARIDAFVRAGGGMIDMDTVASPGSWEAALRGAGAACDAVDRMFEGEANRAFCALRPPGHHAERDTAMGFCLFNSIAVAAAHAIGAGHVQRVFILDWDVHHGNGTEEIFKESAEVFYASIHQSPLYPGTGAASYTGEGTGEGCTLNLPVPAGAGNDVFLALVRDTVIPAAESHEPGLVAISAGFDAHRADPLASCMVDEDGYRQMAQAMNDLASELSAPVLVCLEGGYAPAALAASVVATLEGLQPGSGSEGA